jgi:transcription antitermination factor NusG
MIVVRSNYHLDAVDGLRRQGLRAYWPSYERSGATKRMIAGRVVFKSIRHGILPYVLSPRDPAVDFKSKCERVMAVMDIVRTYSGSPLLLRDRDLTIIRHIDVTMNTPKPEAAGHNFKIGEKVRFVADLSHLWPPGVIVKVARDGRISAEVNMMGRKVPITVFPHQIERI